MESRASKVSGLIHGLLWSNRRTQRRHWPSRRAGTDQPRAFWVLNLLSIASASWSFMQAEDAAIEELARSGLLKTE
jgi:hypothetical protein